MIAKDLEVYKLGMELVVDVYRVTSDFPKSEIYGLTSQMRRAAVSVPSKLAEGGARTSPNELLQFINIARGSYSELETLVEIGGLIGLIDNVEPLHAKCQAIGKMLTG